MKIILTLILSTISIVNIKGQLVSSYGLKVGVGISNQSWIYFDNYKLDFDNKIGISPRIFADFFNIPFFQLEAEIGFLQKGITEKIPITSMTQPGGTGEFISVNNSLNYISISALIKLKYELKIFSPYVLVGPQLNLLLNKNIDKIWQIVYDRFSNTNIDLSIGGGSEIRNILPFSMLIEYRYEGDFLDNYNLPNIDIKNYSHVILIGIII